MWKILKKKLGQKLIVHRIYEILYNPLNKGSRKELLYNFISWYLYFRPLNQSLTINLQNNMKSIVYPDSDSGVANLFTKNVDYYENEFVRKILKKGDFVVDAGCNVGNRTLVLADIIGGALLVDANKECLKRLRINFELNKLNMQNYFTVFKALGCKEQTVMFTDLGGTNCQNKIVECEKNNIKVKSIKMTTIDRELKNIGNPPCSYLKTDLEGFDLDALMGSKETLKNENMKLVRFEKWPDRPLKSFINFFEELDFEIFAIDETGAPNFGQRSVSLAKNLFAISTKHLKYIKLNN